MDVSGCPCEGAKTVSSTMGLRLRLCSGNDAPAVVMDLPLEVISLLVVGCFFGAMSFGGFFRTSLVGEKSEYWNSNFNESTSLW